MVCRQPMALGAGNPQLGSSNDPQARNKGHLVSSWQGQDKKFKAQQIQLTRLILLTKAFPYARFPHRFADLGSEIPTAKLNGRGVTQWSCVLPPPGSASISSLASPSQAGNF